MPSSIIFIFCISFAVPLPPITVAINCISNAQRARGILFFRARALRVACTCVLRYLFNLAIFASNAAAY